MQLKNGLREPRIIAALILFIMAKQKTLIDRIAHWLGYRKQINVSTLSGFGLPSWPFTKTLDYLEAYKSWVFACVNARAEEVSHINIQLNKVINRKTGETEEVDDHEVLSLLRKVNPWMTSDELFEYTQSYKDLAGEAFWYLVRNGDNKKAKISQIWILRPDWISIKTHEKQFILGYEYRVPGQSAFPIKAENIIHFRNFNPTDPYRGMSIIRAAALTIDTDDFAEKYNRKFFINSAIPEIVLETDDKVDDDTFNRLRESWYNTYQGVDRAHLPAILEAGLKAHPFSVSQKDMEFLEGQKFNRDKIFAMFRVPKTVLGMTEDVTVSNAEATDYVFAKRVVKPLMRKITSTLNEFLLTKYADGDDLFFTFDDPVPENKVQKLETYKALFPIGSITPNEVRAMEGLDEVEGLDEFYIPINMIPITGELNDGEDEKTIRGPRLKKKIQIPHKTLRKKIEDDISEAVKDKLVSALIKEMGDPKIKSKDEDIPQTSPFSEEQKEAYWKEVVMKAASFEDLYKRKVQDIFSRQEKETIARLENATKTITASQARKVLFNVSTENKISAGILVPILRDYVEEAGSDALDLLGLSDQIFDTTTANMQAFFRRDVMKGVQSMNRTTKLKLKRTLAESISNGEGIPEITRRIKDIFSEADTSRAEKIARTEVIRAGNRAAVEAYIQSGVVAGTQWYTEVDE